jgi:hypothetical protein
LIDQYQQMSDAELEDLASDRAQLRNATFVVEENPAGETLRAAFRVPSPIEEGEWVYLSSAEGRDRRNAIIALIWLDDMSGPV